MVHHSQGTDEYMYVISVELQLYNCYCYPVMYCYPLMYSDDPNDFEILIQTRSPPI